MRQEDGYDPESQSVTMDRFREFYDAIRLPGTFHTHPILVDQLFDYVDMTVGAC